MTASAWHASPPPPAALAWRVGLKMLENSLLWGTGSEMFIFGGDYIVAGMGGVRGHVILK